MVRDQATLLDILHAARLTLDFKPELISKIEPLVAKEG